MLRFVSHTKKGREEEEALLCIPGCVFLFDIPLLLLLFFFRPDEELKRIEKKKERKKERKKKRHIIEERPPNDRTDADFHFQFTEKDELVVFSSFFFPP